MNEYIEISKLGYGSSADVFKCITRSTKKLCILKKIINTPECIKWSELLYNNEYNSLKLLKMNPHLNIIKMLDANAEKFTIIFEYIPNIIDLYEFASTFEKAILPEIFSTRILTALVSAVKHLKLCGIIHRDIKTENILVNTTCSNVKLIDFGTATINTFCTEFVGTIEYFSPERALDLTFTHSSDIWCVGVIAYELAFGKLPFMNKKCMAELRLLQMCKWSFPDDPTLYSEQYKQFISSILILDINRNFPQ